jgi:inhibitor of cysteine peptidase
MNQLTNIRIYNIHDRKNPIMIREIEMEDNMVSARKKDHHLYVVTSHFPNPWHMEDTDDLELRPRFKDSLKNLIDIRADRI